MRRLTLFLLLVGALAFAVMAYGSMSTLQAGANTPTAVATGILSPQRVPALLADVSSDAAIRAAVTAATRAGGNETCVSVNDNGRQVIDVNAHQALIPASTLKLLTAAAALSLYGPDSKFTTSIKATSSITNNTLDGPLYLVGGGDPLLFTTDYANALKQTPDTHTALETLADRVAAKGIKRIRGSVVGDDSRFDQTRYLASWDPGYQAQGQIGPTGALQVNQGFERFVGGRVPAANPTLHAVALFTALLEQRGIAVDGPPSSGLTPAKASLLTATDSPPVSAIVAEMLTNSDNSTAEMMLRNIGVKASGAGTFSAGITAVKDSAKKTGIPLDGVTMVDGSGLDRSDHTTCAALVAALVHDGSAGTIAAGLPRAGQTGTLANRMTNSSAVGKVEAKTGTLANVSALAGWITPAGGTPFAFAIINNGIPSDSGRVFEDTLAESLAALPATGGAVAYAPTN